MSDMVCALASDTKVETPEGGLTAKAVAGKSISVFTREPSGRVRFRMMMNARKVADQQPVLRIVLETGASFRVGSEQVLFKKGMLACRAAALQPGDELVPAFHYPEGYAFQDDVAQSAAISRESLRVVRVEAAGSADLYSFAVSQTACFFVSAGVLCQAEPTP